MLLPCRLKTRISTVSTVTNVRLSVAEYPAPGWVNFQSATLAQFCPGDYTLATLRSLIAPIGNSIGSRASLARARQWNGRERFKTVTLPSGR
jgi:hypothetical protein